MRHPDQGHERQGEKALRAPASPNNCQTKKGQTKGKVIVEKSHLERPAEGERCETGNERPWRVARGRRDQRKRPPEEDENGKYNSDSFCCMQPKNVSQV